MADYAKLNLGFVLSANSDYTDGIKPKFTNYESTPTNTICQKYSVDSDVGTTIELATFATAAGDIHYVVIQNLGNSVDDGNYVSVDYTTKAGGAVTGANTPVGHRLADGKIAIFPDVSISADLVLRSGTTLNTSVNVLVIITGTAVA